MVLKSKAPPQLCDEQLEKIHLNSHSASIMFSFSLVKCVSCNMQTFSFIDDIDSFNEKPLVCGGDWNLVLDEKDKKGGSTKLSHTKNREKLKSFIDRNNPYIISTLFTTFSKPIDMRKKSNLH
jgi:hypothetical protein